MINTHSTLIVEDHQINIDSYKRALEIVKEKGKNMNFKVFEANNCDDAMNIVSGYSKGFDLVVLDISLPSSVKFDIPNGEVLGQIIKKKSPNCKLLVCTSYNDNFRLNNILYSLNPEAFLVKSDIDFNDLVSSIEKIVSGGTYYSKTILNFMRKRLNSNLILDELDVKILYEISNGSRMKELTDLIPLSKATIEKRKKLLKESFGVKNDSDRDLILMAREKGFI